MRQSRLGDRHARLPRSSFVLDLAANARRFLRAVLTQLFRLDVWIRLRRSYSFAALSVELPDEHWLET